MDQEKSQFRKAGEWHLRTKSLRKTGRPALKEQSLPGWRPPAWSSTHELLCGARTEKARTAVEELLRAWSMLPVDREVARRAAEIRRDQAAQGRTLGMADCLIAATAELKGLKVVTSNVKDFPGVEVVLPGGPVAGTTREG
ncbi:MAG: PIN domain-containing protein [Bacillota bacterium]|nr:PIN domain-containing protein [Bacillota bacterium]